MRQVAKATMVVNLALFSVHATPAIAGGCEKDTDCKGNRVCEDGKCVRAEAEDAVEPGGETATKTAPQEPVPERVALPASGAMPDAQAGTVEVRFAAKHAEDRYTVTAEQTGERCDTPCALRLTRGRHTILVRPFEEHLSLHSSRSDDEREHGRITGAGGEFDSKRGQVRTGRGEESLRTEASGAFREEIMVEADGQTFEVTDGDSALFVGGLLTGGAGVGLGIWGVAILSAPEDKRATGPGVVISLAGIAAIGTGIYLLAIRETEGIERQAAVSLPPVAVAPLRANGVLVTGQWVF